MQTSAAIAKAWRRGSATTSALAGGVQPLGVTSLSMSRRSAVQCTRSRDLGKRQSPGRGNRALDRVTPSEAACGMAPNGGSRGIPEVEKADTNRDERSITFHPTTASA